MRCVEIRCCSTQVYYFDIHNRFARSTARQICPGLKQRTTLQQGTQPNTEHTVRGSMKTCCENLRGAARKRKSEKSKFGHLFKKSTFEHLLLRSTFKDKSLELEYIVYEMELYDRLYILGYIYSSHFYSTCTSPVRGFSIISGAWLQGREGGFVHPVSPPGLTPYYHTSSRCLSRSGFRTHLRSPPTLIAITYSRAIDGACHDGRRQQLSARFDPLILRQPSAETSVSPTIMAERSKLSQGKPYCEN